MGNLLYGDAQYIRQKAKVDAARITQKSSNERKGAETALQQFSASLSNKRAMDAAGKNIGAITENISRSLDAATFGSFQQRIAAAEQAGAASAMAGAAGVGGSTVEAYNETMRLTNAMQEEQQARATNSALIGQSGQIGETLEGAVAGMDNNIYRASLDYTQYVDPVKQSTFSKIATLGVAAAATAFGGPQAGMAVINFSESQAEANKGNFDAAGANLMASLNSAGAAAKNFADTSGSYWGRAKVKAAPAASEPIFKYKTPSFGSVLYK